VRCQQHVQTTLAEWLARPGYRGECLACGLCQTGVPCESGIPGRAGAWDPGTRDRGRRAACADIMSELPAFGQARPGGEVKTLRRPACGQRGQASDMVPIIITFTEADYGKKRGI
jgi:hypothetical protein